MSDDFHFTKRPGRESQDRHTASGGLADEMLPVNFIESCEIFHIRQETSRLHDSFHIGAGLLQHSLDICANLLSLRLQTLGKLSRFRIDSDLTG